MQGTSATGSRWHATGVDVVVAEPGSKQCSLVDVDGSTVKELACREAARATSHACTRVCYALTAFVFEAAGVQVLFTMSAPVVSRSNISVTVNCSQLGFHLVDFTAVVCLSSRCWQCCMNAHGLVFYPARLGLTD